ncbi:MAG: hypothetical protein CM15mV47_660 [uncultured marine virus]|nr:MAG: hypothetical protein CM15mV47_660 [uncultured marine virus]
MRRSTSKLKGTPRPVAGKPVVASASATGKPLYVAAKKPAATQTAKRSVHRVHVRLLKAS